MTTMNVHEAKTHLSRLLKAAESGEDVVIERRNAGGTVSRFALTELPPPARTSLFGALRGQFGEISDEDWAADDREIAAMFDESATRPLS